MKEIVASEEPRTPYLRATPRGVLAAVGEFWLAGVCFLAAWRLWRGAEAADVLGMEMTLAYEFLGLMVLRFFLLGRQTDLLLSDEKSGCLTAPGKVFVFLFTGVLLWFQLVIGILALPVLILFEPLLGLTVAFLFVRRVWWGWAHRPRTAREAAVTLAYWKLTRRIQWVAFGTAAAASVLLVSVLDSHAREAARMAICTAAGGVYFLILGGFYLMRDPRLFAFESVGEETGAGAAPDVVY